MPKKERKANKPKKEARNSRIRTAALFLIIIAFSAVAAEISYMLYNIRYVKIFTAKLEVGGNVAFALGEESIDVINFGAIVPEGGANRFVTAGNLDRFNMSVGIKAIGSISSFLSYDNNFIISPGETRQIDFNVYVPASAPMGKYSGKIFLVFRRA
ncbi:MAG: hypothetical protein V1886_01735 [archaeon]